MVVGLLLLLAVVACFVVGLRASTLARVAAFTLVAVAALTVFNQSDGDDYPLLDDLVFFVLLLGTPAVLGRLLRQRGEVVTELAARAEALRAAQAEEAAAAVAEERARLAIGVHDALAHRVGEMSIQAAGAASVADEEPARALDALARIEDTARAALDDIRGVIGVLRRGDAELALDPPRAPEAVPAPFQSRSRGVANNRIDEEEGSGTLVDVLVAVAVFLAFTIETLTSARQEGPALLNVLGVALIAAPLVLRRTHPLPAVVGVFAACALQSLLLTRLGLLVTPIALLIIPAYSVGAHLPLRGALLGLAVCVVGSFALEPGVASGVIGLAAWGAGRAVRDRALRATELETVNAELERAGDAQAARARGEERLRVARELHDAVAHSMTVIVLQAGAAQRVWTRDAAAARVAVDALAEVARDTLAELRVTLRAADPDGSAARLDALDELAARVRCLGLDVTLDRDGTLDDLPAGVGRVAYAVVQEALTNAARHAAPTTVRVGLRREGDAIRVEVVDSGRTPGAAPASDLVGTGTGLQGMAERVEAAGGALRYGAAGPGFRVEARLPLEQEAAIA